jgi:enoyl-CoA hydratase
MGIVGACDLALTTETASFAFTEARIGVAPAMISLTTQDLLTPRAAARCYQTGAGCAVRSGRPPRRARPRRNGC